MKHLFTFLFLFISVSSFAQFTRDSEPTFPRYTNSDTLANKNGKQVYICDNKKSNAYHKLEACKGLNKCTHAITTLTKEEAEERKRVKCKVCY